MILHGQSCLQALFVVLVRPVLFNANRLAPRAIPRGGPRWRVQQFHSSPPLHANRGPTKRQKPAKVSTTAQPLSDESIPARSVRVVDPSTNELGPEVTRRAALLSIDQSKERLICVTKVPNYIGSSHPNYDELLANYDYIVQQWQAQVRRFGESEQQETDALSGLEESDEGGEESTLEIKDVRKAPPIYIRRGGYIRMPSGLEWVPVCKVENKIEAAAKLRAAENARKEAKKLAPEGVKIMELNWAIAEGDLGHRMKKVREFLMDRRRVEIVVAPKKRGKRASREEADSMLKKVRQSITEVEGAKEIRPMQGQVGGVVSIMVEGKRG